jgi:NTE family protein
MTAPPAPSLALVLSGGGARAAYQVGVLQAIAERVPDLTFSILTGVSAGAINTMFLAGHPGPFHLAVEHLRGQWLRLTPDQVYTLRPVHLGRDSLGWLRDMLFKRQSAPPSVQGLLNVNPLRKFLDQAIDFAGVEQNLAAGRVSAVALSATCFATGQTVTFVQGAEDVPMWERHMRVALRTTLTLEHMMASSAIPIVFPAVRIDHAYYGDGSVRLSAPLAPAIHLGAQRLLAIAMRPAGPRESCLNLAPQQYPTTAEVLGLLLNTVFLDSLDADAERLVRINHLLKRLHDDARPTTERLRQVDLLVIRPSRDVSWYAQGLAPRLSRMMRWVLKGMGGERPGSLALLSYLLFEPEFTGAIMDLGYDDTRNQWDEIARFLDV